MSSVAFGAPDTYEIFVVLPTNRSLSLKVNGTDRVDALRRRIGAMPELIDASGAWSIHGWSAPKILLGSKQLLDGDSLDKSGFAPGCVVCPVYDSTLYSLPVIDPDFYSDMVPRDMEVKLPEAPLCVKENWQKGTQYLSQGWSDFWSKTSNLCNSAGTGLAISQDHRLRFVVEGIAPGGAADKDGRVREGDVIVAVDGCECVSAEGLSDAQVASLRRAAADEEQGGWMEAAEYERDGRAITAMGRLEKMLRGPGESTVELHLRRPGGEVYRVVLARRDSSGLAATYL